MGFFKAFAEEWKSGLNRNCGQKKHQPPKKRDLNDDEIAKDLAATMLTTAEGVLFADQYEQSTMAERIEALLRDPEKAPAVHGCIGRTEGEVKAVLGALLNGDRNAA